MLQKEDYVRVLPEAEESESFIADMMDTIGLDGYILEVDGEHCLVRFPDERHFFYEIKHLKYLED